jgi:predicted ArsR family transcriptional regulator
VVSDDFAAQVDSLSALAEPARRALYLFVVAQAEPVSRDQAAAGTGLPRHTAKFHLDRLVTDGLLSTEYRRLSGRQGPGAGRPSKLYRRSERQVALSLPERHYELAAEILAGAVEEATRTQTPVQHAVQRVATRTGGRLAGDPPAPTARPGPAAATDSVEELIRTLASHGYEPRRDGDTVVLANCPFHELARAHTTLVCGMNLALITALLEERGHPDLTARLDPASDRCCVTVRTSGAREAGDRG